MGNFANVPVDKYDSLSPEDKAKVDAYRNQERNAGNYKDVISRESNKSVDTPARLIRKTSAKN